MTIQVTEVDIGLVKPKDGPIAFASFVLDDQRLFDPIRKPVGLAIERTIIEKLKKRIEQARCWTRSY